MKILFKTVSLCASVVSILAASANAANVTWQTPLNITGPSDVVNTGTDAGTCAPFNGNTWVPIVVNGVCFDGWARSFSFYDDSSIGYWGGGHYFYANSSDSGYNDLLSCGAYAGASPGSFTVGVKAGHSYLLQIWVNDGRNGMSDRFETFTGGANTSQAVHYGKDGVMGQYIIGTFVADGSRQTITMTPNESIQLNFLSLRDITPSPIISTGQEVHAMTGNVMANFAGDVLANDLINAGAPTLLDWSSDKTPFFQDDTLNNGAITPNAGTYLPATFNGGSLPAKFTYNLNTTGCPSGYDISEIRTYAGWNSSGAALGNQKYELLVHKVGDAGFTSLGIFKYTPFSGTDIDVTSATKLVLAGSGTNKLASGVDAVQFAFMDPGTGNAVGGVVDGTVYLEVDVLGAAIASSIITTGQEVHAMTGNVMANFAGDVLVNDLINAGAPTLLNWSSDKTPFFQDDTLNNGAITPNAGTYLPLTLNGGSLPAKFTYNLNTAESPNGYDITEIRTYAGWNANGAALGNQKYELLVHKVGDAGFISLGIFKYAPFDGADKNVTSATKLVLKGNDTNAIASGVDVIQFAFMDPGTGNGIGGAYGVDGTVYLEVDVLAAASAFTHSNLESTISRAQELYDAAVEGTLVGEYPIGSKGTLQVAIANAQAVDSEVNCSSTELITARQALNAAIYAFQLSVNGGAPVLHHILGTGQSLSVGWNGGPPLTTTQPYNNLTLSGLNQDGADFAPLVEGATSGGQVETISSAMANLITSLSPDTNFESIVTRHGVPGWGYPALKKGGSAYALGMTQVKNAMAASKASGKNYQVAAVTTVHGEWDHDNGNGPIYAGSLKEWQHDYDTDVKAITGQTNDVPMFLCQMSSFTMYNSSNSLIPSDELFATENFNHLFLVCPKYFLVYSDGVHLTAQSYRLLGEYYGKAIKKVVLDGERWRPLTPDTISMVGTNITVKFHVPAPPLVFDTTNVLARANYGFEYADDSSSAAIYSVSITGPDTVVVSLNQVPTGSHPSLRYAHTGTAGSWAGANQPGSARGNLRDSDETPSLCGNNLANWLVHFNYPVTFAAAHPIQIDSYSFTPGQPNFLTWQAVSGGLYFVDCATSLTQPVQWSNLYSISGSDPGLHHSSDSIYTRVGFTNSMQQSQCFFRLWMQ